MDLEWIFLNVFALTLVCFCFVFLYSGGTVVVAVTSVRVIIHLSYWWKQKQCQIQVQLSVIVNVKDNKDRQSHWSTNSPVHRPVLGPAVLPSPVQSSSAQMALKNDVCQVTEARFATQHFG